MKLGTIKQLEKDVRDNNWKAFVKLYADRRECTVFRDNVAIITLSTKDDDTWGHLFLNGYMYDMNYWEEDENHHCLAIYPLFYKDRNLCTDTGRYIRLANVVVEIG